ncbi:GGDEF domain-containing protein [Marispirochaeta aestuarii]|uniref:GGDEF domain-containing protein n=1 Tax=Marispirochaeta aestuarii TaxID=1963862 RepID=UPI0029C75B82|nr:GGDEF domain-containing protein [Marispirochaeta aestuarii]
MNWKNRTTQQLVSYEALFKLIDEIHPLEDILEIAQKVARQWKYFANVASWRLVVRNDDTFTVIDGVRGEAGIETVQLLSSWDAHFMQRKIPTVYPVKELPDSPSVPEHFLNKGISEISVIPFVKMDTCYAVLTISARHEPFSEIDKKFIRIFSSHFSSLVHNILMQRRNTDMLINKASHDSLTGILNRGAIMERLDIYFRLSKRTKESISIIIADIDHFKHINDTYGHMAGDKALKAVSDILRTKTRDSDHLGRYGGEEFLFVLYSCKSNEALLASERIRSAVEEYPITIPQITDPIRLTMSFGISTITEHDDTPDSLVSRADEALYKAKNAGRNRCFLRI